MLGSFFVFAGPDPRNPEQGILKSGVVKAKVGEGQWLLEFTAKGYRFSNVFSADKLTNFAFFETEGERQAFIEELMASQAPKGSPHPETLSSPEASDPY
jgi:hypothetical protein